MKKLIFNGTTTLLLLLMSTVWHGDLFANGIIKKKSEFGKEIKEEFPISADGEVKITNKYGNVNITHSKDNKVKFTISITVKADSKREAEDAFDRLTIEFDNSSSSVEATTNFSDEEKRNWKVWKNLSYEIHYEISLPNTVDLDIYNKYGNTYLDDMKGKVNLDLKYGNLKTGNIGKDLKLELGYGKADLGNIQNADITIKYSKLDIENMKDLHIESKYSHLYIDKVDDIKSETKYDKFHLGEVNTLRNYGKYDDFEIDQINDIDAICKFSDFDIKKLNGTAEFEMTFGDVDIKDAASFNTISFTGKHADLFIDLEGAGAKVDLRGDHSSVKMPSSMKKTTDDHRGDDIQIEGTINGSGGMIKATAEYGSIIIYK